MIVQLICLFVILLVIIIFLLSDSIFLNWIFIEIRTLRFIRYITLRNDNKKVGRIAIYIFIQVLRSSLFFISFIYSIFESNIFNYFYYIYNLSILYKIGLFPFHIWVVNLTFSINWIRILFLGTTQKFIPILMLNYIYNYRIILIRRIIRMLISIYFRLGLKRLKIIFSYSIISQRSWIILIMRIFDWWCLYYIIYRMLFIVICLFNKIFNLEDFSNYFFIGNTSIFLIILYSLNFISLIGLPPITGFILKLMLLNYFSINVYYIIIIFVVFRSLIHIYIYIQAVLQSVIFFLGKRVIVKSFYISNNREKFIELLLLFSLVFNMVFIFVVIN